MKANIKSSLAQRQARDSAPRGNALRHGLTSRTAQPLQLEQRTAEVRNRLLAERPPTSVLEEILIEEIARHAAMLEFAASAEGAALRVGCTSVSSLLTDGSDPTSTTDLQLTSSISSEAIARITRYRRAHERGLYRACAQLNELRHTCSEEKPTTPPEVALPFHSESDCHTYLRARIESPSWRCPHCSSADGTWLASRQRWECRRCRKQAGVRAGTVLSNSRTPLNAWFAAIACVLGNFGISASRLAELIEIRRVATARSMLRRIRKALAGPDPDRQLAGLVSFITHARPPTVLNGGKHHPS